MAKMIMSNLTKDVNESIHLAKALLGDNFFESRYCENYI